MLTEQIRPVTYLPILIWQGTAAITLPQAVCRSLPLSVPLPHLSALLGRKGHEVNQQKKYKQSRGLPPRAPSIHPDPMDWQKSHLFQAQRLWERAAGRRWTQGEERVSVRRLGTVVWNRFFSGSHQCGSYFLNPVVRLGSGKLLLLLSLAAISPEHYFHEFPYNDSLF